MLSFLITFFQFQKKLIVLSHWLLQNNYVDLGGPFRESKGAGENFEGAHKYTQASMGHK